MTIKYAKLSKTLSPARNPNPPNNSPIQFGNAIDTALDIGAAISQEPPKKCALVHFQEKCTSSQLIATDAHNRRSPSCFKGIPPVSIFMPVARQLCHCISMSHRHTWNGLRAVIQRACSPGSCRLDSFVVTVVVVAGGLPGN